MEKEGEFDEAGGEGHHESQCHGGQSSGKDSTHAAKVNHSTCCSTIVVVVVVVVVVIVIIIVVGESGEEEDSHYAKVSVE